MSLVLGNGPRRVQLRRTKGWRKPEGCIVVSRPSRWGNPYRIEPIGRYPWGIGYQVTLTDGGGSVGCFTREGAAEFAVDAYRNAYQRGWHGLGHTTLDIPQLRGRDLACWCPLDQPCHADVLLQLANG